MVARHCQCALHLRDYLANEAGIDDIERLGASIVRAWGAVQKK